MRAGAVPVALDRLRVERGRDAEASSAMRYSSQRAIQSWSETSSGRQRPDLELPLAGHHFGVDAGDAEAGLEARVEVRLDDVAAVHLVGADAAVVEALRRREATAVREAVRAPVRKNVYSCSMPNSGSSLRVLLGDRCEQRARVGRVRRHVGEQHLAHDEHVVAAADRVRAREHGLQHAVRVAARSLVRARPVEAPDRELRAVREDLRLRPQPSRRLSSVDPDVLRLVDHVSLPASWFVWVSGSSSRWIREGRTAVFRRPISRPLPHCERSVTDALRPGEASRGVPTLPVWSASSSTSSARSKSAACASCACGSPTSSAS